ncbi:hypothetical protein [Lelliottia sp. RWM.1]|uniref:hypothetical protein n=1 Tax=Lelliottia sp. RWM.1 TaxID=2663242 RepID=UPI00193E230C|nr:hypothetical protein [Lelliottia sp. RWM.1]MBM3070392.1 hypothetical protein [Lelliottia sp. RWM.1]
MKTSPQPEASPVKELVRTAHELAETMSAGTPFIEIAGMVTRLATELDVQLARAKALTAREAELTEALRQMVNAHKTTLHLGYHRIIELGGSCDSPEVMISGNYEIQAAERVLSSTSSSENAK